MTGKDVSANNGGMQETIYHPDMTGVHPAITQGGKQSIVTGYECDTLEETIESMGFRTDHASYKNLSMEDDSHVQGEYKAMSGDWAGS